MPDIVERLPIDGSSERTRRAAKAVLAGRRRGPLAFLPFLGPAVIASVAYMDPGNFATNIQAGAKYGYSLLWVVLLANLIAMLFQALSAKLGIVTGRNLAELCRLSFPKPVVIFFWIVSEIAAMATDLAEFSAPPSASTSCSACRFGSASSSRAPSPIPSCSSSAAGSGRSRWSLARSSA